MSVVGNDIGIMICSTRNVLLSLLSCKCFSGHGIGENPKIPERLHAADRREEREVRKV